MSLPKTGSLVLFHRKFAVVQSITKEKLELRIEGGDSRSVREKDVEYLHPGPVNAIPGEALPDPDCAELTALMGEEKLSFAEFTELAYSRSDAAAAMAAWRLLDAGIWFAGSPADGVTARPAAETEAKLAALKAKENEAAARQALLERIRTGAVLPGDRAALREIEQVALGKAPSSKLMRDLEIEALPEKAHALLLKLKVWDFRVDPYPVRFGVPTDSPAMELPPTPDEVRTDLTRLDAYAIDDAGSGDPDDAVSFAEGVLYVHVADPACVVTAGSPADLEACERGETLYLPEIISTMLPREATERFGLGLAERSPALTFEIRITESGEAELLHFYRSTLHVTRLDYDTAQPVLETPAMVGMTAALERFRRRREEDGALLLKLPEVKIKVDADGIVTVKPCEHNQARELVANAMLAAGSAVAKFAVANGIPLPFVVQPELEEEVERGDSLPAMYQLRRACSPSSISTTPGRHAGLALEPYVRLTSPLRRYTDLVAHRQLRRWLDQEELLFASEMESLIARADEGAQLRRKTERYADDFYKIVYLAQQEAWQGEAVYVNREGDRLTYLIPELAYEFKNRYGGKMKLGESCTARLAAAEPAMLTARFLIGE